jgi:hypothetical protein
MFQLFVIIFDPAMKMMTCHEKKYFANEIPNIKKSLKLFKSGLKVNNR